MFSSIVFAGLAFFFFFDDFVVQFLDLSAEEGEDLAAFAGEGIFLAGVRVVLWFGFEPAVGFHALQHGVECAGADVVAMVAELVGDPLAVDGTFFGMVEDVHLPESDEDLSSYGVGGGSFSGHCLTVASLKL